MEWTAGKLIPAAIFIITAWQLFSDRENFWPSEPPKWSADGNGGGSSAANPTAPSPKISAAGDETYKRPKGWKPVVAESCALMPNHPLGSQEYVLAAPGPIGSDGMVKHTSQDCWEACRDWDGCVSWYWCNDRKKCMDSDWQVIPFKGCELRSKEVIRKLGSVPNTWRLPTFATGFMKPVVLRDQVGAFTMNKRGAKMMPKDTGGLILTTSIHPDPCQKEFGDLINQLSVLNKVDYARLHGYEFHLFTKVVDKSLPKLYSKVGVLRKLLAETSRERAEWILWIDADTIIQELSFQMPYHLYQDRSFIAWGNADYLAQGDQRHGVNTGILLLRNDDGFSPKFWGDIARVSRINQMVQPSEDSEEGRIKAELMDQVEISSSFEDLCDQNVIVYLLRVKRKEYMTKTLLEDGRYCMSCWFKDVPKMQAHTPFVNHWAACQMCTESIPMRVEDGGADNEWSMFCHNQFMDNFAFANHTMSMLLGCEQELIQWGPPLGLPINDWFDCSKKRGEPMCPPLPPADTNPQHRRLLAP